MTIRFDKPFKATDIRPSGAFCVTARHPLYHEPGALHHERKASYRGWDERPLLELLQ